MPSPNNAAKTPPAVAKTGNGPMESTLAKRKSQEFKDKVKGWDAGGAGVAQPQAKSVTNVEEEAEGKAPATGGELLVVEVDTDEDAASAADANDCTVVSEENEANRLAKTPSQPKTPGTGVKKAPSPTKAQREINTGRKAWVRRKSKPQAEIDAELKAGVGAPKKRVVSDGHWRRDRVPKKELPAKREEDGPKPQVIRRSVANVGLKVPVTVQDFVDDQAARARSPRSPSPLTDGDQDEWEQKDAPDYESSGLKVYVKRRKRTHTPSASSRPAASDTSLTELSKPSTLTDLTTPDAFPAKPPRSATAPVEKSSRRCLGKQDASAERISKLSLASDDSPRPSARPRTKTPEAETISARRPLRSSRSKVRETIDKFESSPNQTSSPPAAPKGYGNRIEAWLGSTSDPRTNNGDQRSMTPEPLNVSRKAARKRGDNVYGSSDDDNHATGRASTRRKSKPRLDTIDVTSQVESDVSSAATPTLTRSSARRQTASPIKKSKSQDLPEMPFETASTPTRTRRKDQSNVKHGPNTSRRLATIQSAETFKPTESLFSRNSDGDHPAGHGLKRRLTKHSDLISVLSLPKDDTNQIRSARSIHAHRTSLKRATVGDLMNEITTDELRYQRELRTLVDGVIPVLLQCVLSGSHSVQAPSFLGRLGKDDPSATQPIVDMGVALERLKSTHKRIPMHDHAELLRWGQSASGLYEDYLKTWRMGFDDIVVNLAPAEGTHGKERLPSWSEKAPKNEQGDMLHGNGERVDVAYLLKRPLVRLKYLAKAFKGINQQTPSQLANDLAATYLNLVSEARQRSNDERARLEDDAAARIDPTRARDPRTLAPITGVSIDPTRCVRARDFFDLDLQHSSGQQLTCKIEIFMRDDSPNRGSSSDVLFCEVSTQGRWLLFPPTPWHLVSARSGEKEGEIIVMIRGIVAGGREWQEVFSLQASDEQASFEWVQMLGLEPVPPQSLNRKASFSTIAASIDDRQYFMAGGLSGLPGIENSRPPSPSEIEVPIGEPVTSASKKWDASEVNSVYHDSVSGGLRRTKARRYRTNPTSPPCSELQTGDMWADYPPEQPRYTPERYKGRNSRPATLHTRSKSDWTASSYTASTLSGSTTKKDYQVWMPSSDVHSSSEESGDDHHGLAPQRPKMHRRTSSVPSMDLPKIPKLRKPSQPVTPIKREPSRLRAESSPERPSTAPKSAPAKLQKRRPTPPKENGMTAPKQAPAPAHGGKSTSNMLGLKSNILPSFTPAFLKRHRRSSSPLKHEYEPSTATESSSGSELSYSDGEESVTSESTAEGNFKAHLDDQVSTIGDLKAFHNFHSMKPIRQQQQQQQQHFPQRTPPASIWSASGPSLQPSDSASQGPYRGVPQTEGKAAKTVASIYCWSEAGTWDSLHPEECNIVVTPGLIEAFDLAQAANCKPPPGVPADVSPSASGVKPLVALELTPLVPLRRGTALDISIRSPPTQNSLIRTGNNVMFRSRSPEDCEALYNLINRARINNPTYIALQNARPHPQSNWAEAMDRRNAARSINGGGSWWNLGSRKSSTYRSSGSRAASTAATDSSIGTMNTAFSALRRFSGGSKFFNIARSTITSVNNGSSRSTASESLDSGTSTPFFSPAFDPSMGTPLGMSNIKIRLYIRETASKWRDLGSARMTIMLPPRPDPASVPANPKTTGLEKRILVCGKTKGETLLDATLGESAFERVARTGIAVSIWEDDGQVGARGGVLSCKAKVYMVQMKSERDAAYTFSQVGKLRY